MFCQKGVSMEITDSNKISQQIAGIFHEVHRFAFLNYRGMDTLRGLSASNSILSHFKTFAGIKLRCNVLLSDPVLFEWEYIRPELKAQKGESIIFTPHAILVKNEEKYKTKLGDFTVVVLREASIEEVCSFARVCPEFGRYIQSWYIKLLYHLGCEEMVVMNITGRGFV